MHPAVLASAPAGTQTLSAADLNTIVGQYMTQTPPSQMPLTKDGFPKVTPIRNMLLSNPATSAKVAAQEAANGGPGITYNQIRLALMANSERVDLATGGLLNPPQM